MTVPEDVALAARRQTLRARMLAQRELIANGLARESVGDYDFPRSRTMKFLTRRPRLAPTLLAGAAALLVGGRYARSVAAVMSVARIVRLAGRAGSGGRAG